MNSQIKTSLLQTKANKENAIPFDQLKTNN